MARVERFEVSVFARIAAASALGAAIGAALLLWVVPGAGSDVRPAVASTIVVPLGCFLGWLLSGSRERAPTAAAVCFGLYFLSAFAAARLGTLHGGFRYFPTVLGVQGVAALGLAFGLGLGGRGVPQVERLRADRDLAGLTGLLHAGQPLARREAARALGDIGEAAVRPVLLEALDDPDPDVVRQALAGLVGLAQSADGPRLQSLRQHPDGAIRRQARLALHWIDHPKHDL